MNLRQLAYQYGRLKNHNPHIVCPAITVASIAALRKVCVQYMESGGMEHFIFIPILAYLGLCHGGLSILSISSKRKLNKLKRDEDQCPENVSNIILDDKQGLEKLLEKTSESGWSEWGTVLKTYKDKNKAVIYEILDPDLAKDSGMVKILSRKILRLDRKMMKEKGYTGMHHFHPNTFPKDLGSMHFAINLVDRAAGINKTNLLTFNLPEGPEIIGYDSRYTYIPSDKSKQELIRATPKQIMKYLS